MRVFLNKAQADTSTLEDKLKILITYYDEEKSRLFQLIGDCLKDEEYQLAHFYQQALYQLNGQLQTLQNLDDILYDEKYDKQRSITITEKQLEKANPGALKEYLQKELQRKKEDIEKLNQSSESNISSGTENALDKTIVDLIEKRIKGFKLILKKSDNFLLEFSYRKETLKVMLPHVKSLIKKWILHEDNISRFIMLGFVLTDDKTKFVLKLTGKKETVLKEIKLILSKIVFEIFYFKEFQNESYVQVRTKASR